MTATISDEELAEYREAFNLYEKDDDGFITATQLGRMIRSFGQNPTESELQDMFALYDINRDGKIDLKEFCQMMGLMKNRTHGEDELYLAFKVFDKRDRGFISLDELQEVLPNLGESFTKEYIDEIFHEIDTDSDGMISYDEFLMMMR